MKTTALLILYLIITGINTYGQRFKGIIITNPIHGEITGTEKMDATTGNDTVCLQEIPNEGKSTIPAYKQSLFLQKIKIQKLKGLLFLAGGSVISVFGTWPGQEFLNGHILSGKSFNTNRNKYLSYSGLTLTGLAMMVKSISYFINYLKNNKIAGLKLACQKTSFGASNKACKKVTGITFCIPFSR